MAPLRPESVNFEGSNSDSTLLELYTSEGCSSCPPAESWLSGLKTSPALWKTLFPVAFHVDYWDGLGWPDRFAQASYTDRQKNYATILHQDSIYTPEFITDGKEWHAWFQSHTLPAPQSRTSGDLKVFLKDHVVSAQFTPDEKTNEEAFTINVALLGVGVMSQVKRGENEGQTLQHDFVVIDYQAEHLQSQGSHFQNEGLPLHPKTKDVPGALVAWVSTSRGRIIQVTGGWIKQAGWHD